MTITRGAEKIFRRTRMLFIINVRQQWGLDYFLLFIINARSQMKKTRLFAGKCEMPGLKMHLSPWFWLAAEMSKNFDRPMRSWGYHCLADRIVATTFHTTVSCDISVKDFEAEDRMGHWLRGHEGERNNRFSKIQLVGQRNIKTKHI